jgi:EpsI family protein
MRDVNRFVPAAVLAVGCLLISGVREQKKMPPLVPMNRLSIDVPGYGATRDTVISADERRVAGMSDYVLRFFRHDPTQRDPDFSVYVGYYEYQVQGRSIHSPKNCLPGAGWEALNSSVQPIDVDGAVHPVNRYLLANKGAQALVYYWYQGRGRVEANEYRVKYNLLHDAALYGRTEEALVRIVVPIDMRQLQSAGPQVTYAAADTLATRVARTLIPTVTHALPPAPAT